jgi:hypothetical protein
VSAGFQPFASDPHGLARAAWERALAYTPGLPSFNRMAALQAAFWASPDGWADLVNECFPASLLAQLAGPENVETISDAVAGPGAGERLAWSGVLFLLRLDGAKLRALLDSHEGRKLAYMFGPESASKRPSDSETRQRLHKIQRHAEQLAQLLSEPYMLPMLGYQAFETRRSFGGFMKGRPQEFAAGLPAAMTDLASAAQIMASTLPKKAGGRPAVPTRPLLLSLVDFWQREVGAPATAHLPDLNEDGRASAFAGFVRGFIGHLAAVMFSADLHQDRSFLNVLKERGLLPLPSDKLLRQISRQGGYLW